MSITLKTDRLQVEIARPGETYSGSRFDWTGFITQITLDGMHTYCVPEKYTPGDGTGGHGLSNEFGIEAAIGYDDAQIGECFPKIGIGLLKRFDDTPYKFYVPHEITPFDIETQTGEDYVTFTVKPLENRGYAIYLQKTIRVSGNHLSIHYTLQNTGSKKITTTEYAHNFLGIDKNNISKDYVLTFPYEIDFETGSDIICASGNSLSWNGTPDNDFYGIVKGYTGNETYQWELRHMPSGAGVRETSRFKPVKLAVWGYTHVVSPETFIEICLNPGETKQWVREYEFFR